MKQPSYRKLFSQAVVTWLLFIPIVILNGFAREVMYKPFIGELAAHQLSTVIASIAFPTLAYFRLKYHLLTVPKGVLFRMGLMWFGMTVLFEFAIGVLTTGASWEKLIYDYNILEGRIWLLFLLTILCTPIMLKQLLSNKKVRKVKFSK